MEELIVHRDDEQIRKYTDRFTSLAKRLETGKVEDEGRNPSILRRDNASSARDVTEPSRGAASPFSEETSEMNDIDRLEQIEIHDIRSFTSDLTEKSLEPSLRISEPEDPPEMPASPATTFTANTFSTMTSGKAVKKKKRNIFKRVLYHVRRHDRTSASTVAIGLDTIEESGPRSILVSLDDVPRRNFMELDEESQQKSTLQNEDDEGLEEIHEAQKSTSFGSESNKISMRSATSVSTKASSKLSVKREPKRRNEWMESAINDVAHKHEETKTGTLPPIIINTRDVRAESASPSIEAMIGRLGIAEVSVITEEAAFNDKYLPKSPMGEHLRKLRSLISDMESPTYTGVQTVAKEAPSAAKDDVLPALDRLIAEKATRKDNRNKIENSLDGAKPVTATGKQLEAIAGPKKDTDESSQSSTETGCAQEAKEATDAKADGHKDEDDQPSTEESSATSVGLRKQGSISEMSSKSELTPYQYISRQSKLKPKSFDSKEERYVYRKKKEWMERNKRYKKHQLTDDESVDSLVLPPITPRKKPIRSSESCRSNRSRKSTRSMRSRRSVPKSVRTRPSGSKSVRSRHSAANRTSPRTRVNTFQYAKQGADWDPTPHRSLKNNVANATDEILCGGCLW